MSRILNSLSKAQVAENLKKAVALTKSLTDVEIAELADIAVTEAYREDEVMLAEDDSGRDVYVVVEGMASVDMKLAVAEDSGAQILKVRKNGVVGEFAFIDGARRSASIRIIAPTTVVRFPFAALNGLCDTNPALGYKLMRNFAVLLAQRIRNTNMELRAHLHL